jgi:ATP-binding cassette subfamily F protein 1
MSSVYNFTFDKLIYTSDSITINNFSLSVAGKNLFQDSPLIISPGNIYGLIGKNGCGKSSLLKQLSLTNLFADNKIRVLYVEQELDITDKNPVDIIFSSNLKLAYITEQIEIIEKEIKSLQDKEEPIYEDDLLLENLINKYQEFQNQIIGFNKEAEISKIKSILHGLGFTHDSMEQSCTIFSGGWRMRISLARALYLEPDLLLLDEPTNHLDLEAIIWLGNYMESWKGIAIIVSHNIGFLNETCSQIMNIENLKLVTYRGNYTMFKKSLEQKQKNQTKTYDTYEKKLKEFKKNNSSKNAVNEFIKKHQVPKPEKMYNVKINFQITNVFKSIVIKLEDIYFSYGEKEILNSVNLGIDMNTRATLVGLNGSGKSTLMKLISGEIKPSSGTVWTQNNLRIGYYNQHFEEQLPMNKSPIEYLIERIPDNLIEDNREITVRSYLGNIKLESSAHNKKINELSGGQKARVALVKLIFQQPHILLLDEPTNHLDIETVEALIKCLKNFNGGILLITHEPELINSLESELWVMDKNTKQILKYLKSYDNYCKEIINIGK